MENNKLTDTRKQQLKPLTLSLIEGKKTEINGLTVAEAFENGTNIRTLARVDKVSCQVIMLKALTDLLAFMDAKKTIEGNEQMLFTIDSLIEDFPSLTIEDFLIVFRNIKKGRYGKFFERLKLAEISDCIREYEGSERAEYLEKRNTAFKKYDIDEQITASEMYANTRHNLKLQAEREKKKKQDSEQMAKVRAEFEMKRAKEVAEFNAKVAEQQAKEGSNEQEVA